MPLAITLWANLGKHSGASPTELLKAWNERKDIKDCMDRSIKLSIDSNTMNANPDASTLLAILSAVPGGVRLDLLQWLVPSVSNIFETVVMLTQLALAEQRSLTLHVQPVICHYMLRHHLLDPALLKTVHNTFYHFVLERKLDPGHLDFNKHVQDMASEEANIQAILMEPALEAMVSFSWYQFWTRP
jgi:hypothetical protein